MKSFVDTGALDAANYLAGGEHGEEKTHKTLVDMFFEVDHEVGGNDNTVLIGSYGNEVVIERENRGAAEVIHPTLYEVCLYRFVGPSYYPYDTCRLIFHVFINSHFSSSFFIYYHIKIGPHRR